MTAVRALLSTLSGLAYARPAFAAAPAAETPDPWGGEYAHAGPEPLLDDLLADPVILSVMRADHVEPAELRRQLGRLPLPA